MKNLIYKKNVFRITVFIIVSMFSSFTFAEHCLLPQDFIISPEQKGKKIHSWWYSDYYYAKDYPVGASWDLSESQNNKWNIVVPNKYVKGKGDDYYKNATWIYADLMDLPTSIETDPKDSTLHVVVSSKSGLKSCSYDTNAGQVTATLKNNPPIDINDPEFLQHFYVISSNVDETLYQCNTASISAEKCSWK